MAGYQTIEGHTIAEIVEKKSRFIGHITHVETEEAALSFLEEIRSEHRMARHNVYAYVLRGADGGAQRIRYSDDGEPQKTAGMPTLEAIQHANLVDVAVVVTRYFGGVLLGTGGLVRAYTAATQAAIEAAHIVVVSQCLDITLNLPYALYEQVRHLVEGLDARVISADFTDQVRVVVRVLAGTEEPLIQKLTEVLRGSTPIQISEPFDAPF